jgi:hypothetical protein
MEENVLRNVSVFGKQFAREYIWRNKADWGHYKVRLPHRIVRLPIYIYDLWITNIPTPRRSLPLYLHFHSITRLK